MAAPKKIKQLIKEIKRTANYQNANFDGIGEGKVLFNGKEYTPTEFIKGRTRNYRNSWVNWPIEQLEAWAEWRAPNQCLDDID